MDVTSVNINRNAVPCMCYGKTLRGRRCRIKSRNTYTCYGVELPVCRYHENQNAIHKWSFATKNSNIPEKIRQFLVFYSHCIQEGMNEWVALMVTAELYTTCGYESKEELLELFCRVIFTHVVGECSVCYETPESSLQTRCGHVFCRGCLTQWTTNNITCPMCRQIFSRR
jgi:hypothetical protein